MRARGKSVKCSRVNAREFESQLVGSHVKFLYVPLDGERDGKTRVGSLASRSLAGYGERGVTAHDRFSEANERSTTSGRKPCDLLAAVTTEVSRCYLQSVVGMYARLFKLETRGKSRIEERMAMNSLLRNDRIDFTSARSSLWVTGKFLFFTTIGFAIGLLFECFAIYCYDYPKRQALYLLTKFPVFPFLFSSSANSNNTTYSISNYLEPKYRFPILI